MTDTVKKPQNILLKVFDHNATALFVVAVFVVIALHVSGKKDLLPIKDSVEAMFYTGTPGFAFNLDEDVKTKVRLTEELLAIANKYTEVRSRTLTIGLQRYVDILNSGTLETPSQIYYIMSYMGGSYTRLRALMGVVANLDEADKAAVEANRIAMNEINKELLDKGNAYNAHVDEFNAMMADFPANAAKFFGFIKDAERFDFPHRQSSGRVSINANGA